MPDGAPSMLDGVGDSTLMLLLLEEVFTWSDVMSVVATNVLSTEVTEVGDMQVHDGTKSKQNSGHTWKLSME